MIYYFSWYSGLAEYPAIAFPGLINMFAYSQRITWLGGPRRPHSEVWPLVLDVGRWLESLSSSPPGFLPIIGLDGLPYIRVWGKCSRPARQKLPRGEAVKSRCKGVSYREGRNVYALNKWPQPRIMDYGILFPVKVHHSLTCVLGRWLCWFVHQELDSSEMRGRNPSREFVLGHRETSMRALSTGPAGECGRKVERKIFGSRIQRRSWVFTVCFVLAQMI